jgi:hypothetical protein
MKKIKYFLPFVIAFSLFSCDDYLDINESPNSPTGALVTPDLALAGGLTRPFATFSTQHNELGNVWTNTWGGNVNSITGIFSQEFTLAITNSFRQSIWNNTYITTAGLSDVINYNSNDYDNHKAIALITRAFYMQYIVDLYGDAPFTQMHQGANNLTPAYDDDQAIYRDLVAQIDQAIALIENADGNDAAVGSEDVVYGGSMNGWVKFANTLKLRLLIREATLAETDTDSNTYLNDQFASLVGADFITENVTINPGYNNSVDDQINPFYLRYGETSAGNAGSWANAIVATDYIVDFMDGSLNGVQDFRLTRLFDEVDAGGYVGVEQGADGLSAPDELSFLGAGLVVSPDQDGYIMTASEAYFLRAEAALRGYLDAGNEQVYFNQGVTESFLTLGLDATDASAYITSADLTDGLGWTGSADKLEAIAVQKWLALIGFNGIEGFIELTRLGFIDDIPLASGNTAAQHPNKPRRLLYPTSEFVGNSANIPTIPSIYTNGTFWYVP